MPRRKPEEKPICPRCGERIDYVERHKRGGRVYLYAVHYLGYERDSSGRVRKRVRKCYLGPEDSYRYVTLTHVKDGLVLYGLDKRDRLLTYLEAIINALDSLGDTGLSRGFLLSLAERLRRLADVLEEIAGEGGEDGEA